MKKAILIFFTWLFLFIGVLIPQVVEEWVSRYSSAGDFSDDATAITIDNAGNVYVTGYSYVTGQFHDYTTIKYDLNGDTSWVRHYNGPTDNQDYALAIAVDNLGYVYVTGESPGSGPGEDYATVKYNSSGEEQWVARYNGPGNYWDRARAIAVDDSGYVYITGDSYGLGYDYATIKYDSNGDTVWVRRYHGGYGEDFARDIAVDESGNVYVTGYIDGPGTYTDYTTIKYNSLGDQLWATRYDGLSSGPDFAVALALDDSGNVYVTGTSRDSANIEDFTTIKYNKDGEELWVARYNSPESLWDYGEDIVVDNQGNICVAGFGYSQGSDRDMITIKYNSNGDTLWVRKYNGPGNDEDYGRVIAVDNTGNVYVTGESYGSGSDYDYATIKYNVSGIREWVIRYDGLANDEDKSVSLAVDDAGNVFVTGISLGVGTNNDYATIKYSQTTGIETISDHIPIEFSLSQNYPNPFNPNTIIPYQIPERSSVTLKVFDVLGNEVANLLNEEKEAGNYESTFKAGSLSSGVYFYQIKAGDFINTKKMILIK